MRSVVVTGVNAFSVEEVPDPVPQPDDVLIEVKASGLCGTDLHLVRGHLAPTAFPFTPGHEVAGTVLDSGADPFAPRPGTPVAVHPFIECGTCRLCAAGRPNICNAPQMIGGGGRDGGCSEYLAVPARKVFPITDLPYAAGVIVEPLACVVHALQRIQIPVRRAVIVGGGVTGALFLDLLRAEGTRSVVVIDPQPAKQNAAIERGADAAYASVGDAVSVHGREFELVVDAVGAPGVFADAVDAVAVGGDILQFGIPGDSITASFPPGLLYKKEFRVIGARGLGDDYPTAIDYLRTGAVDWQSLSEPPLDLDMFGTALELIESGRVNRSILAP